MKILEKIKNIRFLKNILDVFKSTINANAENNMSDIERELNKIFDIVSSENEISLYKGSLLEQKINLLELKMVEILNQLIVKYNTKSDSLEKITRFLRIMLIVDTLIMFVNPLLGASLHVLTTFSYYKVIMEIGKHRKESKKVNPILEHGDSIEVIIDNCRRFLEARTNEELEYKDGELEDRELRMINLANEHIELIVNGATIDGIPNEMQEMMVKILQENLGTDEKDFDKLLYMATEKIAAEIQKNPENNTRIRIKKSKNEEK